MPNATVHVLFNASTHVTRKLSAADGSISFGGWVGLAQLTPHTVIVMATGFRQTTATLQLVARQTAAVEVQLKS